MRLMFIPPCMWSQRYPSCIAHSRSPICPCKNGQTQPHTPQRCESLVSASMSRLHKACATQWHPSHSLGWMKDGERSHKTMGFSMFSTQFPTEITKKVTFSAFPIAHSPPVFPRRNHLAVQSYTGTHEAHPSVMHGSISLWLVHACNPSPAIHIKPPPLDGPLHTSNQPLHPSW